MLFTLYAIQNYNSFSALFTKYIILGYDNLLTKYVILSYNTLLTGWNMCTTLFTKYVILIIMHTLLIYYEYEF